MTSTDPSEADLSSIVDGALILMSVVVGFGLFLLFVASIVETLGA